MTDLCGLGIKKENLSIVLHSTVQQQQQQRQQQRQQRQQQQQYQQQQQQDCIKTFSRQMDGQMNCGNVAVGGRPPTPSSPLLSISPSFSFLAFHLCLIINFFFFSFLFLWLCCKRPLDVDESSFFFSPHHLESLFHPFSHFTFFAVLNRSGPLLTFFLLYLPVLPRFVQALSLFLPLSLSLSPTLSLSFFFPCPLEAHVKRFSNTKVRLEKWRARLGCGSEREKERVLEKRTGENAREREREGGEREWEGESGSERPPPKSARVKRPSHRPPPSLRHNMIQTVSNRLHGFLLSLCLVRDEMESVCLCVSACGSACLMESVRVHERESECVR